MKKFTIAWIWMMVLLLSSSVLVLHAQNAVSAKKAPVNSSRLQEDQLKTLLETKFSVDQIISLEKKGINPKSLTDQESILKAMEVLGNNSVKEITLPGKPSGKAILDFPWIEGFEEAVIPGFPTDWLEEIGDWTTANNATSTYDADAHSGAQFLRDAWNATDEFMWTPGFELEAGTPYDFSFWWAGDDYSGWTGDVFYNTAQNSGGATQLGNSFVTADITTTKIYEQETYTFSPTTTSMYYFAIRVNCPTSAPWYLSFDDFRLEPSPECPQPNTLSATNITTTTADLTWISFSGLSDIEIGIEGFTPTGVPTYASVVSPYTATGLSANTYYSFYVRDDCGAGEYSTWNGPFTFATACDVFIAPFLEDFTSWPPLCWDLSGGTYNWQQYTDATTTVYCAMANFWGQTSGNTDVMTTPAIDVSAFDGAVLVFDWSHHYNVTYPDDSMQVLVSGDNGATWNVVWSKGSVEFESNDGAGNTIPGTFVSSGLIDISAYGDMIMVRFFGYSDYGPNVYIDNVIVNEAPSCPQPVDLGATMIAAYSADLLWTSFTGLSDVEFGPAGFPPTGVPTYSGVTSPYTVTGLTSLTSYDFYVRDDCGGGDYSWWSGPYTFMTQPSCPQPFDLGAINITMTAADLVWVSFSGLSDIEFGPAGFPPTGVPTYSSVVSPFNVTGLNSDSPYDLYVRDDCGGGDFSLWSGPYTFLTLPGVHTIPLYETFENGFEYFSNQLGNGADWVINNSYYHNGVQCAHNPYDDSQTNVIKETGVLDLTGASGVWLEFWHIAKTEGGYDFCYIEISTDGGLNYEPLPVESYLGSGIYNLSFNEDSYSIWGTGSEIPDNDTWWQKESFDLGNYLTTNVRIRFRLQTDVSIVYFGWLLDDISIYEPAYGILSGTVTELSSGNPIEGATITAAGPSMTYSVTTLTDGTYTVDPCLTGTYNVTCDAEGYNVVSATTEVTEDNTTFQDFSLTAPEFVVSPLVMTQTIDPNGTAQQTLNLSNTGNGEVDWNASISILSDKKSGEQVKGSQAYAIQIYPDPTGVVSFDTDIPGTFTTISSTALDPFAGDFSATSNTLLYIITYTSGTLYSIDITTGEETMIAVVTGVTSGHNVSGMACDKTSGIMYVSSTNITASDIYTINLTTGVLTLIGTTGIPGLIEIAIDGSGTMYGWDIVADQSFTINKTTAASTLLGSLGYDLNYAQGGNWDPLTDEIFVAAYSASGQLMTLDKTTGGLTLIGDFQGGAEVDALAFPGSLDTWLSIDEQVGTLGAGNTGQIIVNFDATDLLPGVYEAEIHFNTAPNVGSPVVDVTMTVEGLIPAINLNATHSCTDVELTWDMPTGGDPDSWNIYRDGTLLGNSTVMSHTDEMVMTNVEFSYYVKAVYAGEESMPSTPETITVPVPTSLQPIGLSAVANSPSLNHVTLEWNEPNACLEPDGYDIYRDNVKINTALVTELTYVDGPLTSGLYEFKLKAVYYFGESGFSTPAYALIPVGIDETGDEQFRIFPNPSSTMINIESANEISRIKMYNNAGQIIVDKEVNGLNYQIDVSQFDKGSYIISLETGDLKTQRKITIN